MNRRLAVCVTVVLVTLSPARFALAQLSEIDTDPFLVVLGIAQDGGVPQAGSHDDVGWTDPKARHLVVSLGLVDPASGKKWLFEATPDFRQQWYVLETLDPSDNQYAPDGIFLTHAHIGHYTGLMFLGHESMGANAVPVFVMPEMADYLSMNGPWDQLVRFNNIRLKRMAPTVPVRLSDDLRVIPFLVPHRQEYAEVVGYRIEGPRRTVLFLPDIDSWRKWDEQGTRLEGVLQSVDVAYLDGTFFADGEIEGRDMSGFPHPFMTTTMARLSGLSAEQKAKVRFIHLNHSNPALNLDSEASRMIRDAGFQVAQFMERISL